MPHVSNVEEEELEKLIMSWTVTLFVTMTQAVRSNKYAVYIDLIN